MYSSSFVHNGQDTCTCHDHNRKCESENGIAINILVIRCVFGDN